MTNITIQDIDIVVKKEIEWCEKFPDPDLSNDYQQGFIKGLQQARYLISKMREIAKIAEELNVHVSVFDNHTIIKEAQTKEQNHGNVS